MQDDGTNIYCNYTYSDNTSNTNINFITFAFTLFQTNKHSLDIEPCVICCNTVGVENIYFSAHSVRGTAKFSECFSGVKFVIYQIF